MNRLLLSILLILIATHTYAQSSIEAKTTEGRIVILKSDGTWEYKKDTPHPSPNPVTNIVKQNLEADSLPPNFTGHHLETLFNQLRDLIKRLEKSEFETTPEYEKRVVEEKQKPIFDSLTIKDTFYLVISDVKSEYNADLRKMSIFLRFKGIYAPPKTENKKTAYDLTDVNRYSIRLNSSDASDGIVW